MEAGAVTDVHIGGYHVLPRGSIQVYSLTESRLANS
jgi:hypothetical protein